MLLEEGRDPVLRLGARGRAIPLDVVRSMLERGGPEGSDGSPFCCAAAAAFHFRIDFLTLALLIIELAGDGALFDEASVVGTLFMLTLIFLGGGLFDGIG